MRSFNEMQVEADTAMRAELEKGLQKCTKEQQEMFAKLWTGVYDIDFSDLDIAFSQVQRTLDKNEERSDGRE